MSSLEKILQQWSGDTRFMDSVTRWEVLPAREGRYSPLPLELAEPLREALCNRGLENLYSHQAEAYEAVRKGHHTVVVTPTASGKTLCYNLPVVESIMEDSASRALYLFPTKALSQDQVAELRDLTGRTPARINCHTYDGDTEPGLRRGIRHSGHIVVTNPDMLHAAILPHHTKWVQLFQNLRHVVIDEMHQYRGVFGSHVANVIRRLKRICDFYGSQPTFILCSATIANPGELAGLLTGEKVTSITENGAPRAEKHFIFYNPPLVNPELGLRRSTLIEARKITAELLKAGVQTILFTRSRLGVEVLLTYLRQELASRPGEDSRIRGYRGGYLPRERRAIEEGLRRGEIKGVVTTNALELGIDIGALDACVITGYPGSIASTWQQAGRSGRRTGTSLALLLANSEPLNQYIVSNPDYFFGLTPERALADPDNPVILANHVRCAAFELPFADDEAFGATNIEAILDLLEKDGTLYKSSGRFHWMEDSYPAEEISLRSATRENVVIIDTSPPNSRVIGEVDRFSAPMLVHEEAIYMHGGRQYQVEKLDFAEKKAFVRPVEVNYYTDANLAVDLKVLDVFEQEDGTGENRVARAWGDVRINALVSMFKKIRFNTHENLGAGPVDLPETEMHTTAFWLSFPPEALVNMDPPAVQAALTGLAHLTPQVASLFLMGDPKDISAVSQVKAPFTGLPTLYLYDHFPGGVGYSAELFRIYCQVFAAAREAIVACPCPDGCPSCTGPVIPGLGAIRKPALQLLEAILR